MVRQFVRFLSRMSILTMLLLIFSAEPVVADIKVELPRNVVEMNQNFIVRFVVPDAPKGLASPNISVLRKDFNIIDFKQSVINQSINGKNQPATRLEITLTPKRSGKLTIPVLKIGASQSKPQIITVKPSKKKPAKAARDFYIEATATPKNPYVQQEVKFTFRVFMGKRISGNISPPKLNGNAIIEPLGKAKEYQKKKAGKAYQVYEHSYMIYPQKSGQMSILPLVLKGSYVQNRRKHSVNSKSSKIQLNVRAVPAAFTGGYWLPAEKLDLSQSWSGDLSEWRRGEARTRTVHMRAKGLLANQLPEITLPKIDDFNSYANQRIAKRNKTHSQGFIGEHTQEIVVIPANSGDYILSGIKVPWWNIKTDQMEYATLDDMQIHIQEAALGTLVMENTPEEFQADRVWRKINNDESQLWIWLSAFFGLGWLVTVSFVIWRYYLAYQHKSGLYRQRKESVQRCRNQVKNACLANDAEATGAALLEWSKTVWSNSPPGALGQLARRCSPDLNAEIQILEQAIYGQGQQDWKGSLLWDIFKHESAASKHSGDSAESQLEVLHKLS